jgi:hypothetical protein
MEQIDLGISSSELRLVISEADEDKNGFIDYGEFIPLAVDMIQAFTARARSKNISAKSDVFIEDAVLKAISSEELDRIGDELEKRLTSLDPENAGVINTKVILKEYLFYAFLLHYNKLLHFTFSNGFTGIEVLFKRQY